MSKLETYVVDPGSVIVYQRNGNIYALGKDRCEGEVMKYIGPVYPVGELGGLGRGVGINRAQSFLEGEVVYDHDHFGWWEVAGFDVYLTHLCETAKWRRDGTSPRKEIK